MLDVVITYLKKIVPKIDPKKPPLHSLKQLMPTKSFGPLINLIMDLQIHIKMLGMFGGLKALNAHIVQLERVKRNCQELVTCDVIEYVITKYTEIAKLFKNKMKWHSPCDQVQMFSSEQVIQLIDIVREASSNEDKPPCALIFVQRRFTAKILYQILMTLKESDPEFSLINPNYIVGFVSDPFNQTREGLYIAKMNRKVLKQFEDRKVNILVATNVLEEGIDIPTCTLVVRFDKPMDYRAYIQSKGRARHKESQFFVLVGREEIYKFSDKYRTFQQVEQTLINVSMDTSICVNSIAF